MDNPFRHALLVLMLVGVCIACTKPEPVPRPTTRLNANPIEKYAISILVAADAGPIVAIGGKSTYALENPKRCLPLDYTRALGGVRPELYHEQPQSYERVNAHLYVTYVYKDAMLNEDYYGLGVCDWSVQVVTAKIVRDGSFQTAGITYDRILSEGSLVLYCPISYSVEFKLGSGCMSEALYSERDLATKKHLYRIEIKSRKVLH